MQSARPRRRVALLRSVLLGELRSRVFPSWCGSATLRAMHPADALVRNVALLAAAPGLLAHFGPRRALAVTRRARAEHAAHRAATHEPRSLAGSYGVLVGELYRACLEERATPEKARALAAAMTRTLFLPFAGAGWRLLGLTSSDLRTRLGRSDAALRRFLFTAPAFEYRAVEAGPAVVAYDVGRCPFSEHLRKEGLAELGREALCAVDHDLARMRGLRLERTQTLLGGADHCDFRWHVPVERLVRRR